MLETWVLIDHVGLKSCINLYNVYLFKNLHILTRKWNLQYFEQLFYEMKSAVISPESISLFFEKIKLYLRIRIKQ